MSFQEPMWHRQPLLTIGLVVALLVALAVICYLVMSGKSERPPQPQMMPERFPPRRELPVSPKGTVVLFYADWCGHSKQMMPAWKQAAQVLSQRGYQIVQKEHSKDGEEIKAHGIQGFPTIRLYPQGFPSPNFAQYAGDRSAESIVNFVLSGGAGGA